jgi:hypothetical protein
MSSQIHCKGAARLSTTGEEEWEDVDWIHLAHLRTIVNTVMNLPGSVKGGQFIDQLSGY